MHTAAYRANAIFAHMAMVLSVMMALNYATTLLHPASPTAKLSNIQLEAFIKNPRSNFEEALIRFDLEADLSSMFGWNTNMLFASVYANFSSPTNVRDQVVIWDDRIAKMNETVLDLKYERAEYALSAQGPDLRNREVKFVFVVNRAPIAGFLEWYELDEVTFTFPDTYVELPNVGNSM